MAREMRAQPWLVLHLQVLYFSIQHADGRLLLCSFCVVAVHSAWYQMIRSCFFFFVELQSSVVLWLSPPELAYKSSHTNLQQLQQLTHLWK